jgi:hypothetical protein
MTWLSDFTANDAQGALSRYKHESNRAAHAIPHFVTLDELTADHVSVAARAIREAAETLQVLSKEVERRAKDRAFGVTS